MCLRPLSYRWIRSVGLLALAGFALLLPVHAPAATGDWQVSWKNGLKIANADGGHEVKIGGRTFVDWAWIAQESDLSAAVGGRTEGTGVEFRAARLFVSGTVYERLIFKSEFDFAGAAGKTKIKDTYVGLAKIPWLGTVKVGHFKEPFSLEELTSSRFITFMERSTLAAFFPSRNIGVQASNTAFDERMTWAVGGFRESKDGAPSFSRGGMYNLTGRITASPVYEDGGARVVHLGAAYSHKFRDDPGTTFSTVPAVHLVSSNTPYASSGTTAHDGADLFGFEVAAVWDALSLQSEFVGASVDPAGGSRDLLWGVYAEASYFLTPDRRNYVRKKGVFDRVTPTSSLGSDGGCGAWQLAFRYSHLDLSKATGGTPELDNYTFGVNWYLFANARVMLNYVLSDVDDVGLGHATQMRFQVDF